MNEKIKLTSRQILLYLAEGVIHLHEPFDRHGFYKKSIEDFYNWREMDKKKFSNDIQRLKKEKLIKLYQTQEKNIIELTGKGKQKVQLFLASEYKFQYPKEWDKKWRLVIFDVPESKKKNRDILRRKLIEIGFVRLQDSVFIFPFDCKAIIDYFISLLNIKTNVQYIIAETVETEINLVDTFLQLNVLNKKMIS